MEQENFLEIRTHTKNHEAITSREHAMLAIATAYQRQNRSVQLKESKITVSRDRKWRIKYLEH